MTPLAPAYHYTIFDLGMAVAPYDTPADRYAAAQHLIGGWHPDDDPRDLIDARTGSPTFTPWAAQMADDLDAAARAADVDVYAIARDAARYTPKDRP